MNKLYDNLFCLIRAALYGEQLYIDKNIVPEDFYSLLVRAKLSPIVYNTVSKSSFSELFSGEIMDVWRRDTMNKALTQMFMNSEIKKIVSAGEERGITLILFKGITIASLYPDSNLRASCDADILVYGNEQKEAVTLLEELGYTGNVAGTKDHVPVFAKKTGVLCMKVELHDCLWEDYEGKQADILESLNLSAKETLIRQTFQGLEYTTLGITEHLIFQLFHIVKHLFFEGISLRYFTDISLYVNKYYDEIDWKRVRENMEVLHYERFFDCIVNICQRNLGMRIGIPGVEPVTEEMMGHLLADVLEKKDPSMQKDSYETINFLRTYFMRDSVIKESKFQQKRKQFLPLPSELHERYSYARKCPVLLPVAWVHRVIYFIGYKRDCKKYGKDANAAIKKSEGRLDLMRELNLMDTDKDVKRKG